MDEDRPVRVEVDVDVGGGAPEESLDEVGVRRQDLPPLGNLAAVAGGRERVAHVHEVRVAVVGGGRRAVLHLVEHRPRPLADVQIGDSKIRLPFDDFNAARVTLEICVQKIGKKQ